jgi:hypothetical protein
LSMSLAFSLDNDNHAAGCNSCLVLDISSLMLHKQVVEYPCFFLYLELLSSTIYCLT